MTNLIAIINTTEIFNMHGLFIALRCSAISITGPLSVHVYVHTNIHTPL